MIRQFKYFSVMYLHTGTDKSQQEQTDSYIRQLNFTFIIFSYPWLGSRKSFWETWPEYYWGKSGGIDSVHLITAVEQESWATAKMTARCDLYMGALKIFKSPWVWPQLLFPKFLMGFCSDQSYEYAYKCEVRSFTRSWDNRGYLKTLGISLFSKKF